MTDWLLSFGLFFSLFPPPPKKKKSSKSLMRAATAVGLPPLDLNQLSLSLSKTDEREGRSAHNIFAPLSPPLELGPCLLFEPIFPVYVALLQISPFRGLSFIVGLLHFPPPPRALRLGLDLGASGNRRREQIAINRTNSCLRCWFYKTGLARSRIGEEKGSLRGKMWVLYVSC